MTILIIGSDSFIAKKFVARSNDNIFVRSITRIKTGVSNECVYSNLRDIKIDDFLNVDVVLNFVAIVHKPEIKNDQIYDEINFKLAVLNAYKAKKAGVRLFIQMSTIAVYGNTSEISISTPYNPQNSYGSSKLKADNELLEMQDENFKVAIARPPMVYGGGNAPGNMMRLIKLADKGIPLPFKAIDNTRDFINVHNLIQYLKIIADKQLSGIHLISDKQPVSTEYLLKAISKYLGKKGPLFKVPGFGLRLLKAIRPREFDKLYGTLRIETNFPYEDLIHRYTVDDGIREMVQWYKESRKS